MRKLFIIMIALCLLSCEPASRIAGKLESNPFSEAVDLESISCSVSGEVEDGVLIATPGYETIKYNGSGIISFPLFTDVHVLREDEDSGILEYRDELLSFLEGGDYPFAVNLGDTLDSGGFSDKETLDFLTRASDSVNGRLLYAIGNHELHAETGESFDRFFSSLRPGHECVRMMRYVYGPLSIYKLDNSKRTFGLEQLLYLEEALREDESPYKIFIAHGSVASGGRFDQTLAIFGIDPEEANMLYRLMDEYGVSMIFTGHNHKGNILYRFADDMAEFNAAAEHGRDVPYESKGSWYVVEIDTLENEIRINEYSAKNGEKTGQVFTSSLRALR